MRRNRWLPGRSDYYMCGEPGYMVRDCLEDTEAVEAVVATVDGQEEVVATRWSQTSFPLASFKSDHTSLEAIKVLADDYRRNGTAFYLWAVIFLCVLSSSFFNAI
ncbi:hypothetical protein Bca4012_071537 [Brassica carinata]